LKCVAVFGRFLLWSLCLASLSRVAVCCSVLQCVAVFVRFLLWSL